jgi:hypothetical protein
MRPSRCMGSPNRTISPGALAAETTAPVLLSAKSMSALSMGISPAMARIRVDLPLPEAPINATISPRASEKETLLRIAFLRSNAFETRRTSRTACTARLLANVFR